MNKPFKIIVATLGAINLVVGIFIPIALALVIVTLYPTIGDFNQRILIVLGSISSLYKAINIAFLKD